MRLVIFAIILAACCPASAQTKPRALSAAQKQIVQRCSIAASTAAEAFRSFPKSKDERLRFVTNISKRFASGKNSATSPSEYEMVLSLISMEADHSKNVNISDQMDSDLLIGRASARCALSSNNGP